MGRVVVRGRLVNIKMIPKVVTRSATDVNVIVNLAPVNESEFLFKLFQGRRGKGAIYVWASGNGGAFGNSCAYDRYTNLRYSIPVAAIRSDGRRLNYGESCSSIMVTAYSRNSKSDPPIVSEIVFCVALICMTSERARLLDK